MLKKIDISTGWQLGWYPDASCLTRWRAAYGNWSVKDGWATGIRTRYGAMMWAECAPKQPYTFECTLKALDDDCKLAVGLCYEIQRWNHYAVVFEIGTPIRIETGLRDARQLYTELDGTCATAGVTYSIRADIKDTNVILFIDGKYAAELPIGHFEGRYTFLEAKKGRGSFREVRYTDFETGAVLFSEDFSENVFNRRPEMTLDEIERVEKWIPADIPGSVQSSLLNAGIIEDPYYGYNGKKAYWAELQRWIYKKTFTVPEEYSGDKLNLVFGGVAYHGYFFLNGECLGYHEGTMAGPELDITDKVNYGKDNEIIVCVLPSPHPYHDNVEPWILHRWHFNMDITTLGIWRNVTVEADSGFKAVNPHFTTRSLLENTAVCDLEVDVSMPEDVSYTAEILCTLVSPDGREYKSSSVLPAECGTLKHKCTFEVTNPLLWWPNTLGDQPLYDVRIDAALRASDGTVIDTSTLSRRVGIRKLETLPAPNPGPIENKYNWIFSVNGKPFFGKGSNWMPVDLLLRLTPERYELLLGRIRDANMNFIRPWGAGLIETDDFYEKCDEYGILVWQEFLMANGYYTNINREALREAVRTNLLRIRTHASLGMLCAGNEFDPDCDENREIVDLIRDICNELMPEIEFHRACPHGGDRHSYDVNWSKDGIYKYYSHYLDEDAVAVTEFSMATPPHYDTLKKIIPQEELLLFPPDIPENTELHGYNKWARSDVKCRESAYSLHDAHLNTGNRALMQIEIPPMSDCGIPKNWHEFISYMQTAQGLLTQFGQDWWRSRWPDCTLSMSWVANVSDPNTMCWSYIDYFGVPKISYYFKKRSFEPLHVGALFDDCFTRPGTTFEARPFVHNETGLALTGATLNMRLYDIRLNCIASKTQSVNVCADGVSHFDAFCYAIPKDAGDQVYFLLADLIDGSGTLLSRSFYCPRAGEPCESTPYLENGPWISDVRNTRTSLEAVFMRDTDMTGVMTVSVTGSKPAYQIAIEAPGSEEFMTYEDNFFWLEPGESRDIKISMRKHVGKIRVSAWNADAKTVGI